MHTVRGRVVLMLLINVCMLYAIAMEKITNKNVIYNLTVNKDPCSTRLSAFKLIG